MPTRTTIKRAFDALHGQVYGQSAPGEDAEIVTFRVQAEIAVPRLELATYSARATAPARARVPANARSTTSSAGSFVVAARL